MFGVFDKSNEMGIHRKYVDIMNPQGRGNMTGILEYLQEEVDYWGCVICHRLDSCHLFIGV